MARRVDLQQELTEIVGEGRVFFEPLESTKLRYPCLVYSLSYMYITHADNTPYRHDDRYQLTLITKDPDDDLIGKVAMGLPGVRFDRAYRSGSLHHYVYQLYR